MSVGSAFLTWGCPESEGEAKEISYLCYSGKCAGSKYKALGFVLTKEREDKIKMGMGGKEGRHTHKKVRVGSTAFA